MDSYKRFPTIGFQQSAFYNRIPTQGFLQEDFYAQRGGASVVMEVLYNTSIRADGTPLRRIGTDSARNSETLENVEMFAIFENCEKFENSENLKTLQILKFQTF